jgi:hypothetical protein
LVAARISAGTGDLPAFHRKAGAVDNRRIAIIAPRVDGSNN